VVGSADQPRVVEGGQRLAREIPGAHLTVLEHAGHMLQFTRPDELTALVDAALATPAH
jgi:pimeloyl-ACP methyl ester carboxylesterase